MCYTQCFTAMVREDDGEDVLTMGCIGHLERAELNCHVGSKSFVAIKCCNVGDYCNRHLVPRYTSDGDALDSHGSVNGKLVSCNVAFTLGYCPAYGTQDVSSGQYTRCPGRGLCPRY